MSPTRMPRKWARKCERYCCLGATYFPLLFVYSITTWAVWVESTIGFLPASAQSSWIGMLLYSTVAYKAHIFCREWDLIPWYSHISPPRLVLHNSCIHEPRDDHTYKQWLQLSSHARDPRSNEFHCESEWRTTILQEVPGEEAGPRASLLDMPGMCVEDGPSLSLARNLCWIAKL
jgi:hypothetical protein